MKPALKKPAPAKPILPQPGVRCLAGDTEHQLKHLSAHMHTLVREFREWREEQKLTEVDRLQMLGELATKRDLKAMEGRLMKAIQGGDTASNGKLAATLKASFDQLEAAVAANQP